MKESILSIYNYLCHRDNPGYPYSSQTEIFIRSITYGKVQGAVCMHRCLQKLCKPEIQGFLRDYNHGYTFNYPDLEYLSGDHIGWKMLGLLQQTLQQIQLIYPFHTTDNILSLAMHFTLRFYFLGFSFACSFFACSSSSD